jgi:hypothetical protein
MKKKKEFAQSGRTGEMDLKEYALLSRQENMRHAFEMKEMEILNHDLNSSDLLSTYLSGKNLSL